MLRVMMIHDLTNQITMSQRLTKTNTETMTETWQGVWNCLHFRQLRTWSQDNRCYLTIKSDTGQHSQFLRCFYRFVSLPECFRNLMAEIVSHYKGTMVCYVWILSMSATISAFISRHWLQERPALYHSFCGQNIFQAHLWVSSVWFQFQLFNFCTW